MRHIILSSLAISIIIAEPALAEQPVINQISAVTQANEKVYLHPAHGFPGRAPARMIVQTVNQINPVATHAQVDTRSMTARTVRPALPVMAGDPVVESGRS